MSEVLDINNLISEIQDKAARRQRLNDKFFSIPLEHLQQFENILSQQTREMEAGSPGSDLMRGKLQELLIHGSVRETTLAGTRNPLKRLYKKVLFALFKPLLTHQEEFNKLTVETFQQQIQTNQRMYLEQFSTIADYQIAVVKDTLRSASLLFDHVISRLEEVEPQARQVESLRAAVNELNELSNSLRRRLRIGLVHLHHRLNNLKIEHVQKRMRIGLVHLHHRLNNLKGEVQEEVNDSIEPIKKRMRIGLIHLNNLLKNSKQELAEAERRIDQTRRRLSIGLIHLNKSLQRDSATSQKEIDDLSQSLDSLSRRLGEFSVDISEILRDLQQQSTTVPAKSEKREKETPSPSLYNDPLFFDLKKFEDHVRGVEELKHLEIYVPYFKGRKNVLDAGCGTGTFLELLRKEGIGAYGLDIDSSCIKECRKKMLKVEQGDILAHLKSLNKDELDGFFAAQLIEHLPFEYLIEMVRLLYLKLSPGSHLIMETPNTTCLTIYSGSFFADPTHVRPVHPVTLKFVLQKIGYDDIEIKFINPFSDDERLEPVAPAISESGNGKQLETLASTIDLNSQKLNSILFSYKDYAVICRKP